MTRFDSWESYFYPDTYDPSARSGTLRNLYGVRDEAALKRLEYVAVAGRMVQIEIGEARIPQTFGGEHLRDIHKHLFQDVYEWAGEFRRVEISKGPGREFARIRDGELHRYLRDIQKLTIGTNWQRLSRDEFVEHSATVFAYVNQAHPFREGNGRTAKVFMQDLAQLSRFALDFSRVSPQSWNQRSALSRPDLFAYHPEPSPLIPVFDATTIDR